MPDTTVETTISNAGRPNCQNSAKFGDNQLNTFAGYDSNFCIFTVFQNAGKFTFL